MLLFNYKVHSVKETSFPSLCAKEHKELFCSLASPSVWRSEQRVVLEEEGQEEEEEGYRPRSSGTAPLPADRPDRGRKEMTGEQPAEK